MDTIGLDLRQRERQLCVGHAGGRTITEQRTVTSRQRFTAVLEQRPLTARRAGARSGPTWSPSMSS
jgi:hypothetical protein